MCWVPYPAATSGFSRPRSADACGKRCALPRRGRSPTAGLSGSPRRAQRFSNQNHLATKEGFVFGKASFCVFVRALNKFMDTGGKKKGSRIRGTFQPVKPPPSQAEGQSGTEILRRSHTLHQEVQIRFQQTTSCGPVCCLGGAKIFIKNKILTSHF